MEASGAAPKLEAVRPPEPEPRAAEPEEVQPGAEEPRQAAEAAVDETEEKKATYGTVELSLPAELPATVMFDITDLEINEANPMPVFRLTRSILGAEQFLKVRNEIARQQASEEGLEEGWLARLLDTVFNPYGLGLGE